MQAAEAAYEGEVGIASYLSAGHLYERASCRESWGDCAYQIAGGRMDAFNRPATSIVAAGCSARRVGDKTVFDGHGGITNRQPGSIDNLAGKPPGGRNEREGNFGCGSICGERGYDVGLLVACTNGGDAIDARHRKVSCETKTSANIGHGALLRKDFSREGLSDGLRGKFARRLGAKIAKQHLLQNNRDSRHVTGSADGAAHDCGGWLGHLGIGRYGFGSTPCDRGICRCRTGCFSIRGGCSSRRTIGSGSRISGGAGDARLACRFGHCG